MTNKTFNIKTEFFTKLCIYLMVGGLVTGVIERQYAKECPGEAGGMLTITEAGIVSATWPALIGATVFHVMTKDGPNGPTRCKGTINAPAPL